MNADLVPNQLRIGILALPNSGDRDITGKSSRKLSSQEVDERRKKGLCFGVQKSLGQAINVIGNSCI